MGRGDSGVLLRVGVGFLDDGVAYNALGKSDPLAPAGSGGECIFPSLYLVLVHEGDAVTLRVTPIVDEVALEFTDIALPLVAERKVTNHEIPVSVPYIVGDIEVARFAPRGTWIQVQVDTISDGVVELLAKLRVDSVDVEYEVVRESQVAVRNP